MFDLDEVLGKPIYSARLTFDKSDSFHKLGGYDAYGYGCVRSLGVSKLNTFWVGYLNSGSGIPQTTLFKPLGLDREKSGTLEYDVTDVVKAWSQGKVNTGFVLDGRDPFWPPPAQPNQCFNDFNNFKLEITYFPNP
ncbi:MAG: hypothetical protein AB9891_16750 [Anaerolineaceae bacterium]